MTAAEFLAAPSPRRPRRRIRARQCRHRFCSDHRGAVAQSRQQPQISPRHYGAARERRGIYGARLLPGERQAGRRHGACDGRNRRRGLRPHECVARQRPDDPRRRPVRRHGNGHAASRNRSIHWGQEMFDQGSLTREFVKWDYELRAGQSADFGGRSRARYCHVGAARAVSDAAARSPGQRSSGSAAARHCPAARRERGGAVLRGRGTCRRDPVAAAFPLILDLIVGPAATRKP